MPIDPYSLAVLRPRTAAALRSLGCVWSLDVLPPSTPARLAEAAGVLAQPDVFAYAERRRALDVVDATAGETATALLVGALLRDPAGDIRCRALEGLSRRPGPAVDGAIALGLADPGLDPMDRQRLAVERLSASAFDAAWEMADTTDARGAQAWARREWRRSLADGDEGMHTRDLASALLTHRGPVAFVAIDALWEDKAGDRLLLAYELAACAVRTPRASMRRVLPAFRWQARSPFATDRHRAIHRRAAHLIDTATAPLVGLPVSVEDASVHGDGLPRPGEEADGR